MALIHNAKKNNKINKISQKVSNLWVIYVRTGASGQRSYARTTTNGYVHFVCAFVCVCFV